jgi:hypothetical protein
MVRAALSPLAESQRLCEEWLRVYFEVHGDSLPDELETSVQVMLKKDLYQTYEAKMKADARPVVDISKFCELWRVFFPRVRLRPHCDIPGKCWLCARIDKLRRDENDEHTARMLRDAHTLHRGGLFHLEREEYVIIRVITAEAVAGETLLLPTSLGKM